MSSAPPARSLVASSPNYAYFFTPHQDDETLSMGAAIKEHVAAGRKVYVVLLTDGGASAVCSTYPTRAACVTERDREFLAAVYSLGATPIIPSDRMSDGKLTATYANWIMSGYYYMHPTASFKTMSETDAHPDHAAAGRGLALTGLKDARWYMKHSEWGTHPNCCGSAQENVNTALNAYHPIGWLSVPGDFQLATFPVGEYNKAYAK